MLRSRRTTLGVLACGAVAVLITGLIWGLPRTVPGTPTTADIALSTLDFGDLDAEPLPEPRNDKDRYSRIIESVRMAEAVVDPREIDPILIPDLPAPLPKPTDTTGILAEVAKPILTKYGMLAGYSILGDGTCRSGGCSTIKRPWSVQATVLRLPDETAARAAASEIEAADFAVNPANVAVRLPEYPAAQGHWRPTVPTLGTILAHGPFIVTLFVSYATPDLGELTRLASKTLAAELPKLDAFAPTPVSELPNLRFDTDGMLRRMVPSTRGTWPYPYITKIQGDYVAGAGLSLEASGVVYGPTGTMHWLAGAAENAGITDADIESVAQIDRRWLIRTRNAITARRLAAEESVVTADQSPMAAPRVPDAKCLRREAIVPVYYCVVQVDRYVAVVTAIDEKSAHQIAAAQYALLVRNR